MVSVSLFLCDVLLFFCLVFFFLFFYRVLPSFRGWHGPVFSGVEKIKRRNRSAMCVFLSLSLSLSLSLHISLADSSDDVLVDVAIRHHRRCRRWRTRPPLCRRPTPSCSSSSSSGHFTHVALICWRFQRRRSVSISRRPWVSFSSTTVDATRVNDKRHYTPIGVGLPFCIRSVMHVSRYNVAAS